MIKQYAEYLIEKCKKCSYCEEKENCFIRKNREQVAKEVKENSEEWQELLKEMPAVARYAGSHAMCNHFTCEHCKTFFKWDNLHGFPCDKSPEVMEQWENGKFKIDSEELLDLLGDEYEYRR